MQIHSVASSSEGNSTLISNENTHILIDCGISLKALTAKLGLETVSQIDAVFVTHEHGDHIRGIGPFGRKYRDVPVYINEKSYQSCQHQLKNVNHQLIDNEKPVFVGDFEVRAFNVVHDTANAYGFFVTDEDLTHLCYLTDTGMITETTRRYIENADVLFIESNYDPDGLNEYMGYPNWQKERIRRTHLSNEQTIDIIREIGLDKFSRIFMGHLSPRTNRPHWVKASFNMAFPGRSEILQIAPTASAIEI
ncbi:MAG: MBL fold metallo-hydrolase [Calditrichaeota bacterium]|jgi:phosphoribosyl 1,2-cyclic phosphodiesterase|nr:MBL fold metallo-hydrolase [Calditrichota bacterium]MBT7618547.1 MBL fold metallo-hydrolase [Calditrichota bacterium]MBT7787823.1 MBL fold metallo-hydrolase [Calditrichota bacterium]